MLNKTTPDVTAPVVPVIKNGFYENGSIAFKVYDVNGEKHREDGPAIIWYNKDGSIKLEWYYKNGTDHREDGPSYIYYNEDGSINIEEYYLNGKKHREDGPAYIGYNKDGSISFEEYYKNDVEITSKLKKADYFTSDTETKALIFSML